MKRDRRGENERNRKRSSKRDSRHTTVEGNLRAERQLIHAQDWQLASTSSPEGEPQLRSSERQHRNLDQ